MLVTAPHFSIDVPDTSLDMSTHVYLFPELGGNNPARLTLSRSVEPELPDLDAFTKAKVALLEQSFPNAKILLTSNNTRSSWHYAIIKFEWGDGEMAMSQKEIHLFAQDQQIQHFHFIGVSPTADFAAAEATFDAAVASFKTTPQP